MIKDDACTTVRTPEATQAEVAAAVCSVPVTDTVPPIVNKGLRVELAPSPVTTRSDVVLLAGVKTNESMVPSLL